MVTTGDSWNYKQPPKLEPNYKSKRYGLQHRRFASPILKTLTRRSLDDSKNTSLDSVDLGRDGRDRRRLGLCDHT